MKLIAYRLYLSAQVLVTIASVVLLTWWATIQVHDRYVAKVDFECYDQKTLVLHSSPQPTVEQIWEVQSMPSDDERWEDITVGPRRPKPPDSAKHWAAAAIQCGIRGGYFGKQYSSRAWSSESGMRTRSFPQAELGILGAALFAPFALYGLFRWVKWLAAPAVAQR